MLKKTFIALAALGASAAGAQATEEPGLVCKRIAHDTFQIVDTAYPDQPIFTSSPAWGYALSGEGFTGVTSNDKDRMGPLKTLPFRVSFKEKSCEVQAKAPTVGDDGTVTAPLQMEMPQLQCYRLADGPQYFAIVDPAYPYKFLYVTTPSWGYTQTNTAFNGKASGNDKLGPLQVLPFDVNFKQGLCNVTVNGAPTPAKLVARP